MNLTFPSFDDTEIEHLRRCLESRWVTQGPITMEFERLIAERHCVDHVLATTSCTAALHLSSLALGLGAGDEVIVPAFTWVTSAHCAEYVGAKVVFADVDPDTYNLDPDALAAAVTPRTRAVVAVHLFGLSAEMDAITSVANHHQLAIIEDAACAIGTTYHGRPVGGIGDIGCFSFHPRKIVTTGEGGAVTTNDGKLASRVASVRNHGSTGMPDPELEAHGPWTMGNFDALGFNLRLSDIQAAVGVAQFNKLDRLLSARREAARRYHRLLDDVDDLVLPIAGDAQGHSYQSYVVRVGQGGRGRRNRIMEHLAERGIQTRPGTHAVHRLGYYRSKYRIGFDAFPNAGTCEDTTITLPLFPGMTEGDQIQVSDALHQACAR